MICFALPLVLILSHHQFLLVDSDGLPQLCVPIFSSILWDSAFEEVKIEAVEAVGLRII